MRKIIVTKENYLYRYTIDGKKSPLFTTLECLIETALYLHDVDNYTIQYKFDLI